MHGVGLRFAVANWLQAAWAVFFVGKSFAMLWFQVLELTCLLTDPSILHRCRNSSPDQCPQRVRLNC